MVDPDEAAHYYELPHLVLLCLKIHQFSFLVLQVFKTELTLSKEQKRFFFFLYFLKCLKKNCSPC